MPPRHLAALLLFSVLTMVGLAWIKQLAEPMAALVAAWPALPDQWWRTPLELVAAAAIYFGGMGIWLAVLSVSEMSVAYPVGIGLSLATAAAAGFIWLGEPATPLRLAGIVAIGFGIRLLARPPAAG